MDYAVSTEIAYLFISIAITVWVGRTLFKNGRVFLVDALSGSETLADSVNHLLVVGFYLINIGYVCLALKDSHAQDLITAIEMLASKVGLVMLVLGAMHFFNLYVFNRIRQHGQLHRAPPPVMPSEYLKANG
jgi:hypothetical protein